MMWYGSEKSLLTNARQNMTVENKLTWTNYDDL